MLENIAETQGSPMKINNSSTPGLDRLYRDKMSKFKAVESLKRSMDSDFNISSPYRKKSRAGGGDRRFFLTPNNMAKPRRQKIGPELPKASQTPSQLASPPKKKQNLSCFMPRPAQTPNLRKFLNKKNAHKSSAYLSLSLLRPQPPTSSFSLPTGSLLNIFKQQISENETKYQPQKKDDPHLRKISQNLPQQKIAPNRP